MAAKDKSDGGEPTAPAQPASAQPVGVQPGQQAQPVQIVPTQAVPSLPARRLDELPDGPHFIVNGQLVDAEGRPINEDGSLKEQPR